MKETRNERMEEIRNERNGGDKQGNRFVKIALGA